MNITGIRFNVGEPGEVEVDGHWYEFPRRDYTRRETLTLSDLERIVNDQRCIRCKQPLNNVSPGFSRIASVFVCTHCLRDGEEIARTRSLTIPAQETKPPFRTGDIVHHRPTGEDWTVAAVWEGSGDLAWCGWPDGRARISDCDLIRTCTDDRHWQLVEEIAQANSGSRTRYCQRLLEQRKEQPQ